MSDYRRYFVPGGTYFFTIVTYGRRPILVTDHGRMFLRNAIRTVRFALPFEIIATVLLPDHWHLVMRLPPGDIRYSLRLKQIKESFTRDWLAAGFPEAKVSPSQWKRGEKGIWQPRFWEHCVDGEDDLVSCVDYIHWNPRKHDLVRRVRDWRWSSFHRFVRLGEYNLDWGGEVPLTIQTHIDHHWGEA
jgi:putative transposase